MMRSAATVMILGSALLAGCGGGDGGSSSQTGTLKVSLTDAPACGFKQVNVTVTAVKVHQSASAADSDAGWQTITLATPKEINLLDLTNGLLEPLGTTVLPAGHYTQIRLVLDAKGSSIVPTGTNQPVTLKTPSGAQSGYKVVGEFVVAPDTLADLVLDFNACKSVVRTGNGGYILKPVVSAVPLQVSGSITGYVASTVSNATVFAEQDGQIIRATIPDSTGFFRLSPLLQSSTAGNYDVVIAAPNFASGVIQSVPVAASESTALSTDTQRLSLNSSTMATVSGTVSPAPMSEDSPALVRAVQLVGGKSVETHFTLPNLTDGSYSLSLPTVAPSFSAWNGSLPLNLSPDNSAAGKYTLEASRPGYTAETSSVIDLSGSTGATTQNFTLTPQ